MARRAKSAPAATPSIDHEWRGRMAFETLQRAEEIKADKGLMREVKRHAARAQKTTAKILETPGAARPGRKKGS